MANSSPIVNDPAIILLEIRQDFSLLKISLLSHEGSSKNKHKWQKFCPDQGFVILSVLVIEY
jgi:hypothetical protein